jgi:glycosyltransferase involved in cell wall biosynthesis
MMRFRRCLGANPLRQGEGGQRTSRGEEGLPPPLISIVTIVLNQVDALENTIQSVLGQQGNSTEYIIIDGGSTDGTLEVLQGFDTRLEYWVSEPDQGISDAFNKGISLCRGEIIGLLNCGDWYAADTLQRVGGYFTEHEQTDVLCGGLQYWRNGKTAYRVESRPELLRRDMTVTHPSCFVRRRVYSDHGGFDGGFRYAMDYELFLRYFMCKVKFTSTSRVLTNMEHDGVSEQHWREALKETHKARKRHDPGSLFAHPLYLAFLIGKKRVRFLLERMHLQELVRLYRERLALVKKTAPKHDG